MTDIINTTNLTRQSENAYFAHPSITVGENQNRISFPAVIHLLAIDFIELGDWGS